MTKRNLSAAVQMGIGLLLTVSSLALYWQYLRFMYELTFMSNFCTGVFFVAAGVYTWKGRRIPEILYLCFGVLLFLVMAVCLAFSGNFSFSGVFVFLHLINPLTVLIYFFFASNMEEVSLKQVPAAVLMPGAYLIFALIFGSVTGNYIYFFLDYTQVGTAYTILFVTITAAILLLISGLFWRLNRFINRRKKHEGA